MTEHEHILYKGAAFTLAGGYLSQDDANWADVAPSGRVKCSKHGQYYERFIGDAAHQGPRYHGSFETLNKAYQLALNEACELLNPDGTFRTGDNWPTVWTRDIAYATDLGLGLWAVQGCMKSLRSRVIDGEIEQDTGTGGSWPISSDRVVWGWAAWELYCVTGDREWLAWACGVLEKTCLKDEEVLVATGGLMKGESSVLDWRRQTYPEWMNSADIGDSVSLSTMVLHAGARRILADMFAELGDEAQSGLWREKAAYLSGVTERFFRIQGSPLYGQYLYGRGYPVLSEKIDTLGNMLCVLLGQCSGAHAAQLVASLPHCNFGIPCIHPQMSDEVPPYHNRASWPFIEGYYARVGAMTGNENALALALACMTRAALLCGTNKENLLIETGLPEWLVLSSDRQLWSIAGLLGAFYKGLFGIKVCPDRLELRPCVPQSFNGEHELMGVNYRGTAVHIRLKGHGRRIATCRINGQEVPPVIRPGAEETVLVEIELASDATDGGAVRMAGTERSLPTPEWIIDEESIAWQPVPGADYYRIYHNGLPVSQTEYCRYTPVFGRDGGYYQVMAVALDGRESYLNEPNEYPRHDARIETRPCGLSGDEVWTSSLQTGPDGLFYDVNVAVKGVYRVSAFYANGMYDVADGNTCALRSLYMNGERMGTLAFPHTSWTGNWEKFMYSTSLEVVLQPGAHRVELLYDEFSRNMNVKVNDMVIKHLRFTRI